MATIQVIVPEGVVGGQEISVKAPDGATLQVVVRAALDSRRPLVGGARLLLRRCAHPAASLGSL